MIVEVQRFEQAIVHRKESGQIVNLARNTDTARNLVIKRADFVVAEWKGLEFAVVKRIRTASPCLRQTARREREQGRKPAGAVPEIGRLLEDVSFVGREAVVFLLVIGKDQRFPRWTQKV